MSPLLSVVIASYNHAAFIGDGIRSILEQSFQDFEILITDDASQDNSATVIRQFSDPRINLEVFPQNRGFSAALNAAIRRSRGQLVSVLGSDDYFLPGTFAKQIEFLRARPDIAAVFGMPKLVNESGLPVDGGYREFTNPFHGGTPSRKDWLRYFFVRGNCLCHPTVMIRRAAHNELGLYDPRFINLTDFDMWVRLCMMHEIHVMPDELTARRVLDKNRNLSAPRSDTILRCSFETSQILKHYRTMSPDLAREVFADDLRTLRIDTNHTFGVWLAELALHSRQSSYLLFGLETMFDTCATAEDECPRLIELTGKVNPFNIEVVEQRRKFQNNAQEEHVSRNQPCPCGSGLKYKHCHGRNK
jgi:glycosyltransferase involved in cell wall biosynthesis